MTNIKAVIVDDEQLGIDSFRWELNRITKGVDVIAEFTSPNKALDYLNSNKIDILFLDIQMPEMNGFELLNKISNINFSIIFVTAFDEYALKAFKYSALEYLLKPVDKNDLQNALNKYIMHGVTSESIVNQQLELHQTALSEGLPEKIIFATKEAYEFIKPLDILYCEADSNYTTIYLNNTKLVVSKTLKDIENMLHPFGFLRIHQSYLINPRRVARFLRTRGGSVEMDNGKEISVARSKKDEVMNLLLNR